jgi:hypothetical protein
VLSYTPCVTHTQKQKWTLCVWGHSVLIYLPLLTCQIYSIIISKQVNDPSTLAQPRSSCSMLNPNLPRLLIVCLSMLSPPAQSPAPGTSLPEQSEISLKQFSPSSISLSHSSCCLQLYSLLMTHPWCNLQVGLMRLLWMTYVWYGAAEKRSWSWLGQRNSTTQQPQPFSKCCILLIFSST